LVAILLFVVIYVAVVIILGVGAGLVWFAALTGSGQPLPEGVEDFDPAVLFIANNIMIALGMPLGLLAHRIVYRQSPRWLSSVAGGFRWRPFWRFFLIAAGGLAVSTVAQAMLSGGFGEVRWNGYSLVLILTIVLTTPFQCAAEEYTMRGLLLRSVGSWFARPWLGLAAGLVVNAVVFMFLHSAGDPWLNAFYLLFATLATFLVWRTGGLEAAVALHVANNVISESLLPFQPDEWANLFNREAGVGDPTILIQMGIVVVVAALLWWQGSRLGMVRTAAPAADALDAPAAQVQR
jgi:membrane protease YdiL (CAAX protease family)